jgi:hypothetical protein
MNAAVTIASHPSAIQAHRNVTAKATAVGVMSPSFKCRSCHGFKHTRGRKPHPAGGYRCADCVAGKAAC